jgi:bifunctional NMN adenylyltransferase/nudix hydrolase
MKKYDLAVVIGRFQPFHNGHKALIEDALSISNQVLVLVGSAGQPRTYKNPWTFDDRERMIDATLWCKDRVIIEPLYDQIYNDTAWIVQVQDTVAAYCTNDNVVLVGHKKDETSYYLDIFPQWDYKEFGSYQVLNATTIRELLFVEDPNPAFLEGVVPNQVYNLMADFTGTEEHASIVRERRFIEKYKLAYAGLPYPPVFVTSDAIVFCLGHVLMIKRRSEPGRGLWALPGGFLDAESDKSMRDCAIRELKEETGIKVPPKVLIGSIVSSDVYDAPERSLRGRTITHAFHIQLNDETLPKIKGGSDASQAKWIPIGQVRRDECFEDHYQILEHYIGA